ncbi:uncharacterized protein LOC126816672 isoform X2 [Patella vulgata]|uniref:uncharacterized protein LOC126816672 isoform X2 n=1 Tax=Patella vulgata TaxID=6465 RepID=UPI00217F6692|nr:uncharacterized protein LOC126816672 isoform X2 [Patella vulgata]
MDKELPLIRQSSTAASETVYDAPDSVITLPDYFPVAPSVPSSALQSPVKETLSKTVSNVTSGKSTVFSEQTKQHNSASETQPLDVSHPHVINRNIWSVWGDEPQRHDDRNQMCLYNGGYEQPVLPYYYHKDRKSKRRRREKKAQFQSDDALKIAVIIVGLITLLIFLVTVFVAVYYGLTADVLAPTTVRQ